MNYVIIIYATTFMRLITLKNKNKNDIIFDFSLQCKVII